MNNDIGKMKSDKRGSKVHSRLEGRNIDGGKIDLMAELQQSNNKQLKMY